MVNGTVILDENMAAPVMASLSRIPINKIGATQVGAVAHTEYLPMKVETAAPTNVDSGHPPN